MAGFSLCNIDQIKRGILILIFSTPRREQKKTNHLLNTESYIDVFYVPYILFLKSISPFHVRINTWPKNYNLSWEKVFFVFKESIHLAIMIIKKSEMTKEKKRKRKSVPPLSFYRLFALCGQSGIESKDWTLHSSWSSFSTSTYSSFFLPVCSA